MNEIDRRKARDMNMLPTTRIGWEQKQTYMDWLARLSAEGYLTAEEYDARMDWLQAARTEEEVKVVFSDLPRLRATGMEPSNPVLRVTRPENRKYFIPTPVAGVILAFEAAITVSNGLAGNSAFFISLVITLLWVWILLVRWRNRG